MVVLGTAYWPNLHYMHYLLECNNCIIDVYENFEKQSFRNRTVIMSANGPLALSVPVKKWKERCPVKDIEISYAENWQKIHWRALESAYKNSPYFDFLEDELKVFYQTEFRFLFDFNMEQLNWLKKVYRLRELPPLSNAYIQPESLISTDIDLRQNLHPKHERIQPDVKNMLSQPYYQTFSTKFDFVANLSVLDLIFNEGIKTASYLSGNRNSV
jgi:hypothetical protein